MGIFAIKDDKLAYSTVFYPQHQAKSDKKSEFLHQVTVYVIKRKESTKILGRFNNTHKKANLHRLAFL